MFNNIYRLLEYLIIKIATEIRLLTITRERYNSEKFYNLTTKLRWTLMKRKVDVVIV